MWYCAIVHFFNHFNAQSSLASYGAVILLVYMLIALLNRYMVNILYLYYDRIMLRYHISIFIICNRANISRQNIRKQYAQQI